MIKQILAALFTFYVCSCGVPGTENGGSCDQQEIPNG